jgi:hypothetical protein
MKTKIERSPPQLAANAVARRGEATAGVPLMREIAQVCMVVLDFLPFFAMAS